MISLMIMLMISLVIHGTQRGEYLSSLASALDFKHHHADSEDHEQADHQQGYEATPHVRDEELRVGANQWRSPRMRVGGHVLVVCGRRGNLLSPFALNNPLFV